MQQDVTVHKEIKLLRQISKSQHPNIIKFYDHCILIQKHNEYATSTLAYLLMELAEFGSLETLVANMTREEVHQANISSFVDQAFEAFAHLQQEKIAHCDIKPENILIASMNPLQIKICDIGSGKHLSTANNQTSLLAGTISFMSPEMLRHAQKPLENKNDFNLFISDVFSFGLVLLYVCTSQKFRTNERSDYINDDEGLAQHITQCIESAQKQAVWGENNCIKELLLLLLETNRAKRQDFVFLKQHWDELKTRSIRSHSVNSMFFEISQQNIQIEQIEFNSGKPQRKSIPFDSSPVRPKNRKQVSLQDKIGLTPLLPLNQELLLQNEGQEQQNQRNNSFRTNGKYSPTKQIRNTMKTNQFHISPGVKKLRTKPSIQNESQQDQTAQNNQIQLVKVSEKKIKQSFNNSLNCSNASAIYPNKFTLSPIKAPPKLNQSFNQNGVDFSDQQFRQTAHQIHLGEFIQIKNISFMQQTNFRHSPTRKIKLTRIQND